MSSDRAGPGFLAAILVAAALPALPMPPVLLFSIPVAAVHAFLFGVPLYWLVSRRREPGLALSVAAGFAVGAAPLFILLILFAAPPAENLGALLGGAESAAVLREQLIGWAEWLAAPAIFGACGAAGGAAFWLTAIRGGQGPRYGERLKDRDRNRIRTFTAVAGGACRPPSRR